MVESSHRSSGSSTESRDNDRRGTGDHDQPYAFGQRPTTDRPFPLSTHDLARAMVVRGRVQEARVQTIISTPNRR